MLVSGGALPALTYQRDDSWHQRGCLVLRVSHRIAVELLTAAGVLPNTTLALAIELFRDWKSPVADAVRTIIKPYLADVQKFAPAE